MSPAASWPSRLPSDRGCHQPLDWTLNTSAGRASLQRANLLQLPGNFRTRRPRRAMAFPQIRDLDEGVVINTVKKLHRIAMAKSQQGLHQRSIRPIASMTSRHELQCKY